MGSSGSGVPDCTVGSIVWVRRRNGSWWPGKILSPDELDASHLTSPRSGTPVKLLGREDASVDWYNLEKSKRVKAFRCGDFDDCIERVEASEGTTVRKREKYARREDAILHALELERDILSRQGKPIPERGRSKAFGVIRKDVVSLAARSAANNGRIGKPSNLGLTATPINSRKAKEDDRSSWEDDRPEVAPRMRGLQEFELRIAPSSAPLKRKVISSGALDTSFKPVVESNLSAHLSGDHSMGRFSHANGREHIGGISWGKRRRSMYTPALSRDSLDRKEVSLRQIERLPSLSRDGDFHVNSHPRLVMEESSCDFIEDVESDSSESDSSYSDSDSSQTEDDVDEAMASFPDIALERRRNADDESMSSDDQDESSSFGDMSYLYPHDHVFANEAVSKWHLKGKGILHSDAKGYNGLVHGSYQEVKGSSFSRSSLGQGLTIHESEDISDDIDENDTSEKDFGLQMVEVGDGGYAQTPRVASKSSYDLTLNMIDWGGMAWESDFVMKRPWEDRIEYFARRRHLGRKMGSTLIDVDLKVQANYQTERVPFVSLISKVNGRAIVGHPVPVEVMADGSSENLLPRSNNFHHEHTFNDKNKVLPPPWRTARRTSSRVPRPHHLSSIEADEEDEERSFIDQEREPHFKKLILASFTNNASLPRKNYSRPPSDRKIQKKPVKKVSVLGSQKTKALSSIGVENNGRHGSSNFQIDGLIKPESSGPPTVACIPVKLVFSRLLEKINRPLSKPASKFVLPNSETVRKAL